MQIPKKVNIKRDEQFETNIDNALNISTYLLDGWS